MHFCTIHTTLVTQTILYFVSLVSNAVYMYMSSLSCIVELHRKSKIVIVYE